MIESSREKAQEYLERKAASDVSYWVNKAEFASDGLSRLEARGGWNLGRVSLLSRTFQKNRFQSALQHAAREADDAAHKLDILQASEGLSIESRRSKPVLKRPYDTDELVGRINGVHISLRANRENGKVIGGTIDGMDIKYCRGSGQAQRLFNTYYPEVLRRDQVAASINRNSSH